jgi:hypothetical protein
MGHPSSTYFLRGEKTPKQDKRRARSIFFLSTLAFFLTFKKNYLE